MRVLVVADDDGIRDDPSALLGRSGHEVRDIPSAARAVSALKNCEFDVMFTDLRMGREGGVVLLAEVRAKWPRRLEVMLTGRATVAPASPNIPITGARYSKEMERRRGP